MIIKPIELVNICSLFPSLHTGQIPKKDLKKLAQDSALIDSENPVDTVIEASLNSGLITLSPENYILTAKGKKICKYHKEPACQLAAPTKEAIIKNLLLDIDSDGWCCSEFIVQFKVDVELGTFVYERKLTENKNESSWLIRLSSVGLINVDSDKAVIERKYLGLVNEMLLKIRNPMRIKLNNTENENTKVGNFSENLAIQHEKNRLSSAGFPSLAMLVEHISIVDQSAGFDILSFSGIEPQPNKHIFIEVKSTVKEDFGFYWSFNEMNVAKIEADNYWIYGYTNVDIQNKYADGPIRIQNPLINLSGLGYLTTPLDCYVSK
jgi:hypothetical protein